MPLISQESIREVLATADLVDLVRGSVPLKRAGARWQGRCPFHDERTPSFSLIPPENTRYYCHGCGASGDAVNWMMEKEGAGTFVEAIEALAERFGVSLRYEQASPEEEASRQAASRRHELLARAAAFYAEYLWRADEASEARKYLCDRGFSEELARRFDVGFSPSGGTILAGRAIKLGFSRDQLVDSGLARLRGSQATDFFQGRIMFPITDARRRVIGFGARTLDPNERAKYVNSPEGPLFKKREVLFGLAQARPAAAKAGWLVVVEGYTDVMALVASGVEQAVACMGTALTSDQLRQAARVAPEVRLCFDADAAGQKAAWRSAEAARGLPLRMAAIPLPPGRDPGDMAKTPFDLAELRRIGESMEPLVTFLIASRASQAGVSPTERDQARQEITDLLRGLPDSIEKDEGVRLAAGLLQLSRGMQERLWQDVYGRTRTSQPRGDSAPTLTSLGPEAARERRLLTLAVALSKEAPEVLAEFPVEAMRDPQHQRAVALLAGGEALEQWPPELEQLAGALRAGASIGEHSVAEFREASYRVQLPLLETRARELGTKGDDAGALRLIDLIHRIRGALRGEE